MDTGVDLEDNSTASTAIEVIHFSQSLSREEQCERVSYPLVLGMDDIYFWSFCGRRSTFMQLTQYHSWNVSLLKRGSIRECLGTHFTDYWHSQGRMFLLPGILLLGAKCVVA